MKITILVIISRFFVDISGLFIFLNLVKKNQYFDEKISNIPLPSIDLLSHGNHPNRKGRNLIAEEFKKWFMVK